ncbi:MAG: SprT family zinc-dependent metalloprotease [Propionibacteriaceae bacterium]|nr:SprT family zinc-dependent metalloprotease [Propionibacteriaceae bacterium]
MNRRRTHTSHLQIGGVRAEVTYKDVKNLRLRVLPPDGRVKVSVPFGVPESTVKEFLSSREGWLRQVRADMLRAHPPKEALGNGSRVRLWGEWLAVRVVDAPRAGARLADGVLTLSGPDVAAWERGLENLYRRELQAALPELFARYEPLVGRQHTSLKLRRMTSRWGTCNHRTGSITLNTALAEHPPSALEYVVVHELMHLIVRGHGPQFYAGMDQLLPDWKHRRRALRVGS